MVATDFSPEAAAEGTLPPWEMAKALAFDRVIRRMAEVMDRPASKLLGQHVDEFIASEVVLKGGGHPTARAVRKAVGRGGAPDWYPGKWQSQPTGRPDTYTAHVKNEVARVAMELKRKKLRTDAQESSC